MTDMTASDGSAAVTRLVYDGSNGELFRLWAKVLLLTIVTFGIYRFWGRTRIRKYLWNHTSLLGSRLEYDGTGGELFRRFLVAGLMLILIVLPANIAQLVGLRFWMIGLLQGVQLIVLFFLVFVAIYAGRRYRFSRTAWRGMRGGLDGSALSYGLRSFGYMLLWPLTLSFSLPWQLVGLWRYEMNNTGFGDWEAQFEGSGRKLFKSYLAAFGIAALGAIAAIVIDMMIGFLLHGMASFTSSVAIGVGATVITGFFGIAAFLASLATAWLYFSTRTIAYLVGNTSFGRVRFRAEIRKRDLFRLMLGNFLITAFSLNVLSPFVAQRMVRFFCRHIEILNAQELDALTQAEGRRERSGGEGLAQLLDTGGFA